MKNHISYRKIHKITTAILILIGIVVLCAVDWDKPVEETALTKPSAPAGFRLVLTVSEEEERP